MKKWGKLYFLRYAADEKYKMAMKEISVNNLPFFILEATSMFGNNFDEINNILKPEYVEKFENVKLLLFNAVKERSLKWRFKYFTDPLRYYIDFNINPPWI